MIGLEFRENVIATVKKCDITHCGLQGLSGVRCKVNVISCLFENNSD